LSTIGENWSKSNISPTCPHNMVNFGPLAAEIGSLVWGTPANFNGFTRFGIVTAATSPNESQPNLARCLAVSWAGALYIFGGCCPVTEFCQVRNSLCAQVLRSVGRVTARHSSSGRQPSFAALSRGRHLYSAGRPSR